MTSALFTPSTLARIRLEAEVRPALDIAKDLGWELDRLRRTARAHGVELVNPYPTVEQPVELPPNEPKPRVTGEHLDSLSLEEIIKEMPERQALVLSVLKRYMGGQFLTRDDISERLGRVVNPDQVKSSLIHISSKLARGRYFRIESHKGPTGGYRLVMVERA